MQDDLAGKSTTLARRPLKTRGAAWPKAVAQLFIRAGLVPNQISVLSMIFSGLAAACFLLAAGRQPLAGAILLLAAAGMIQLRLLCNLVDGLMAIEGGLKSKVGDLFNDLPDRISDAVTLLSVGYSLSWTWGPVMGWLATVTAILTAYIRVLGGSAGTTQYFIGPMAKQQRMGLLTVACVLAAGERMFFTGERVFPLALILIVIGSLITAWRRLRRIAGDLNSS